VEMNLRAILLIMGFSVLGTELYHPKIRETLAKSYFKQLPLALELSLESLPSMISGVPDLKSIIRNPVQVIYPMMAHADERIGQIRGKINPRPEVIVITGEIGAGKTTCIKKLVQKLKKENTGVKGIFTSRLMENGETTGYDVADISSEENYRFLSVEGEDGQDKIGKYYIDPEGLKLAGKALKIIDSPDVIIVDEIGKLELAGGGWAGELDGLFQKNNSLFILSVRKEVVDQVIRKWNLNPVKIFEVADDNRCEEVYEICTHLQS